MKGCATIFRFQRETDMPRPRLAYPPGAIDPSRSLAPHSCGDAKSALPTASRVESVLGLRTKPMRRREFISREAADSLPLPGVLHCARALA